ncbi:hypothetical protein CKM354_000990200 [Cercospora kikuchii]|uniref:Uncharacterized protein n=1 Tax=Cercospora kikuchii TaxID=84275 RepID=A0A9P3CUB4_9PEZI|nr:uncharacterized protein CKM354_000990200 [Cercospora kikuchii]GIZ46790.1 hypothetical protein CKM354_000990200 [Cercospora kikuchii]
MYFRVAPLAAILLSSIAELSTALPQESSPPPPLCHYILRSSNSCGGGSPYQSQVNNWDFSFSIVDAKDHKKKRFTKILPNDLKPWEFSISREDYKGPHNMWVRGQLWRGDYHWNLCRISFDEGEYIEGKREKVDIDSGIVSVVTSKCVVEYEC